MDEGREHAEMTTESPDLYIKKKFILLISGIKFYFCFCKAAAFASGLVFSYKLAERAIVSVFITYFTDHENDLRKAAAYVNFQEGLSALLVIVMFYISQACGHLKRIILCLIVTYACGMAIFGLTGSNKFPKSKFDLVSIIGLILVAVGRAGLMPFVRGFTTKQLEYHEPDKENIEEERVNAREETWWRFAWVSGSLVAIPLFSSSWTRRFIISGSVMGIAFSLFMLFSPLYHKRKPDIAEKPFTCIRVFRAALLKRHMEYPSSPAHFYCHKLNDGDDGLKLWPRAKLLRWLDKAAIIEFESTLEQDEQKKAGRLCTVTEVQQTKYILKMVPMWSSFLVFGVVLSVGNTFFAEQADDLKSQDLLIYLVLLQSITSATVSTLSTFFLSKWFSHVTKLKRIMMRIYGGMVISILCSAVAWRVEVHRLDILENEYWDWMDSIPMRIWWLAPQFFLLGVMDGLATDGLEDFTTDDDHLSKSMKKFLSAINTFVVTGIGSALNILCVYPNTKLFDSTLNWSRLDLYFKYLTLYGTTLNCVYLLMISIFIYKGSDAAQVNEASMVTMVIYRGSDTAQVDVESMSETVPNATISFNEESINEELSNEEIRHVV